MKKFFSLKVLAPLAAAMLGTGYFLVLNGTSMASTNKKNAPAVQAYQDTAQTAQEQEVEKPSETPALEHAPVKQKETKKIQKEVVDSDNSLDAEIDAELAELKGQG
jgi:alpha-L-arabinofuranosidase